MRRTYTGWLVFLAAATAGCLSDRSSDRPHRFDPDERVASGEPRPAGSTPLALGPTVTQDDPPPPLSGGTLAVVDEREAIAADPDRDLVYIVDHVDWKLLATIPLALHDEPGRIALDREGRRAYVVLRRGGAVVSLDLTTRTVASRIDVCPMPRGIAWDATAASVIVVCAGGEIVTVDASLTSRTSRNVGLTDLRDVVITSAGPVVSTFRTAELARLDASGSTSMIPLPSLRNSTRRVAWRTLAAEPPPGSSEPEVVVVSQESGDTIVERPAEYYGSAPGIGAGTVVNVGGDDIFVTAVLPIDVAVTTGEITIVSAANTSAPLVRMGRRRTAVQTLLIESIEGMQLTSVAYTKDDRLLALSREPAALIELPVFSQQGPRRTLALSEISRKDTGHDIFHIDSGRGIACASCHPEGRDDGNSWRSVELGPRRTPSLVGTVASTAPYHWNGEAEDMRALAAMTFTSRMRGPALDDDQTYALEQWLTRLPALVPSPATDPAAAERGRALFESDRAKCSGCHSGPARTNNQTVDVGTGGRFQVPSLVNATFRAPYLHDGTVGSIVELVAHGHGSNTLTPSEAADVSAYVRTF